MSNPFIDKLNEMHLCSWFILPLLGMSTQSFGKDNFVNAYQIRNRDSIGVLVLDINICMHVASNPNYQQLILTEFGILLLFNIPQKWNADYQLFLQGKYSKMSEEAKENIRKDSGLKWKKLNGEGVVVTDALLMVLDRNPVLADKWSEILGVEDENLPEELHSLPADDSFIELEKL